MKCRSMLTCQDSVQSDVHGLLLAAACTECQHDPTRMRPCKSTFQFAISEWAN